MTDDVQATSDETLETYKQNQESYVIRLLRGQAITIGNLTASIAQYEHEIEGVKLLQELWRDKKFGLIFGYHNRTNDIIASVEQLSMPLNRQGYLDELTFHSRVYNYYASKLATLDNLQSEMKTLVDYKTQLETESKVEG